MKNFVNQALVFQIVNALSKELQSFKHPITINIPCKSLDDIMDWPSLFWDDGKQQYPSFAWREIL